MRMYDYYQLFLCVVLFKWFLDWTTTTPSVTVVLRNSRLQYTCTIHCVILSVTCTHYACMTKPELFLCCVLHTVEVIKIIRNETQYD